MLEGSYGFEGSEVDLTHVLQMLQLVLAEHKVLRSFAKSQGRVPILVHDQIVLRRFASGI